MTTSTISTRIITDPSEVAAIRSTFGDQSSPPETDLDFMRALQLVRPNIRGVYSITAFENEQPRAMILGRVEQSHCYFTLGYLRLFKIPVRRIVFLRSGSFGEITQQIGDQIAKECLVRLSRGDADLVVFSSLAIDNCMHGSLRKHSRIVQRKWMSTTSPHWRSHLPVSYDSFLQKRPSKHRYWLRRLPRVLEKAFPDEVRYKTYESEQDVDAFCAAADMISQKTYQRALGAGFTNNAENRMRIELMTKKGCFRGYILFVRNTPSAFWAGEQVGNTMYLGWTGFDPALKRYEIGTILFLKMLEDLIERSVSIVDYGIGGAQYKERFGDECTTEQDLSVYAISIIGLLANLLSTMEACLNASGHWVLERIRLRETVKRVWRGLLAKRSSRSTSLVTASDALDEPNVAAVDRADANPQP